jgi:hypothetical protein
MLGILPYVVRSPLSRPPSAVKLATSWMWWGERGACGTPWRPYGDANSPHGEDCYFAAFVAGDLQHMYPEAVVNFERVALTPEEVRRYSLTTYPPKTTDLRSGRWSGETCQLEALPPDTLARLLDTAIAGHLDPDVLAEDREAEALERRQIAKALPSAD